MTLVIVDDEVFIVEMMKAIIDWEGLGLVLAGTAYDGMEACKLIEAEKPDIVITDIRLPGIDGLGVVRTCYMREDHCRFIVISGYRQFEYAQTAMSYGVKEYLLKPIKEQDINRALKKMIEEIEVERVVKDSLSVAEAQLDDNRVTLQKGFMRAVIAGEMSEKNYDTINRSYMLNFQPGIYQMMILKVDTDQGREEREVFFKALGEKFYDDFMEQYRKHCFELVYQIQDTKLYLIVNFDLTGEEELLLLQKELMDRLVKYTAMFKNVKAVLAKSSYYAELNLTAEALEETEQVLRERIVPGMPSIIGPKVLPEQEEEYQISKCSRRSLKKSVINRDVHALSRALRTAFTEFETTKISGMSCRNFCFSLSKLLNSVMLNEQIIFDVDWQGQEEQIAKQIDECGTYHDIRKYMIQTLRDRFEDCIDREDGTDNRAVRIVKQYIAKNYMKKIQLQDLATLVYLNPVYLSVCFKNEVGINVVDYIIEYRVERAKELLRNTQENVYAVAEAVGFSEPRYFTKIFKRYVGKTPNEYRNGVK